MVSSMALAHMGMDASDSMSLPATSVMFAPIEIGELPLPVTMVNSNICTRSGKNQRLGRGVVRLCLAMVLLRVLVVCGLAPDQFHPLQQLSEPHTDVLSRRLSETIMFSDMEMVVPLLILTTTACVNCCAVFASMGDSLTLSATGALKMLFLDSVDQLVSVFLVMWCHKADAEWYITGLAWLSCLIGLPAFFLSVCVLNNIDREREPKPIMLVNGMGFAADAVSLGVMFLIELTSNKSDLMPAWLKVLDFLWSFMSIVAEILVLMSAFHHVTPPAATAST